MVYNTLWVEKMINIVSTLTIDKKNYESTYPSRILSLAEEQLYNNVLSLFETFEKTSTGTIILKTKSEPTQEYYYDYSAIVPKTDSSNMQMLVRTGTIYYRVAISAEKIRMEMYDFEKGVANIEEGEITTYNDDPELKKGNYKYWIQSRLCSPEGYSTREHVLDITKRVTIKGGRLGLAALVDGDGNYINEVPEIDLGTGQISFYQACQQLIKSRIPQKDLTSTEDIQFKLSIKAS